MQPGKKEINDARIQRPNTWLENVDADVMVCLAGSGPVDWMASKGQAQSHCYRHG